MENKELTECNYCGKMKDDVMERTDLYAVEIMEEYDATMFSCEECAHARAEEV